MELEFLLAVMVWFGGSAAIASLVALLVDALKRFGVVKDGDSGKWAAGFNLLGLVGFSVYFFLNPAFAFAEMDAVLKNVLSVVQVILAYVMQLGLSPKVHVLGYFAKLPLLGYSLSED